MKSAKIWYGTELRNSVPYFYIQISETATLWNARSPSGLKHGTPDLLSGLK